jgi:DMSO/TMAO reductase YedYZ molybdopterin-dependent catalytic subunit
VSDSRVHDASLVPAAASIERALPDELELRPVEGMARWLGRWLHPIAFRMISMIEQRTATMSGPLTPTDGYFRRDRHRHPRIDPDAYRLRVTGVARPRELSLADLRALPVEERVCVMECAGNGNHLMGSAGLLGQARWAGPSLATVLAACDGPGDATHFAFHGLDPIPLVRKGYHYGLSLDELVEAKALLALTINGEPLPRERGFPVRLIVPGLYSMSHVKWLGTIEGKTKPHMGIHNTWVFTNKELRDGKWQRVQARWIGLKSMVTRCTRIATGGWLLTGWAWGGDEPITGVDVSVDGGKTWVAAELRAPDTFFPDAPRPAEAPEHAWSVWTHRWIDPSPGEYLVASRARTASGKLQDLEQDPNVQGHFDQTRVKWRRLTVP